MLDVICSTLTLTDVKDTEVLNEQSFLNSMSELNLIFSIVWTVLLILFTVISAVCVFC